MKKYKSLVLTAAEIPSKESVTIRTLTPHPIRPLTLRAFGGTLLRDCELTGLKIGGEEIKLRLRADNDPDSASPNRRYVPIDELCYGSDDVDKSKGFSDFIEAQVEIESRVRNNSDYPQLIVLVLLGAAEDGSEEQEAP
jgi:hypothetical protein